jgi:uncharacterized membrane protein YebE (DUF533 family)
VDRLIRHRYFDFITRGNRQMPNFGDLIGAFMQNATAPSVQNRMGSALENLQQDMGGAGGAGGLLGSVMDAVKGGLSSAAQNPAAAGGIGAVLGSLIGGGGDSVKGAMGGGAIAVLAGVAMKALMNGGQASGANAFSGGAMPLGVKAPETHEEEQALEANAGLVVKAMINAAKSDGEIGPKEMERILGKLKESGMDEGTQHWVMMEMSKPLDLNAFVGEIPNTETAAEVYAASLLAIEVDTDAERQYLQQLAQASGLNQAVVQYIHQAMGAPV